MLLSAELEHAGNQIGLGQTPAFWKGKSFASLKPLGGYVADLLERLAFLGGWLKSGTYPGCYWLSGFFFPQAFLTGSTQNFARKYVIPIDTIDFDFIMMPKDRYALFELLGPGPRIGRQVLWDATD